MTNGAKVNVASRLAMYGIIDARGDVASGVNVDIVEDGKNGYLAETEEEWLEKLSILIESENLRIEIGKKLEKV